MGKKVTGNSEEFGNMNGMSKKEIEKKMKIAGGYYYEGTKKTGPITSMKDTISFLKGKKK